MGRITRERSMELPLRYKKRATLKHCRPTPKGIWEKIRFWKITCSLVCTGLQFIIANKWKQTKCLWRDERIKNNWHVYTRQYDSAGKKNDELVWFSRTKIKLGIKISEESQNQKKNYHKISLTNLNMQTHELIEKT